MSFLKVDNSFIGHFFTNERLRHVISATPNSTEPVGGGESRVEKEERGKDQNKGVAAKHK